MPTLEKIENEVKQLPKAEQAALRDWLENILEDESGFTGKFNSGFQIHSLKGHRVLTPKISQSEIAGEMFSRP